MDDFDGESELADRYRALRTPELQQNLIARHGMTQAARKLLCERGFLELEMPMLVPAEGDAHELLVSSPSHPGLHYALTRSAQLPHQLLMVAGYDRCFQFTRCFHGATPLPESTRLEFEMSFVGLDEVIATGEAVLLAAAAGCAGVKALNAGGWPRLTYADAIRRYGSAQPDLRFDMELKTVPWRLVDGEFRSTMAEFGILRALPVTGPIPWSTPDELQQFLARETALGDNRLSCCMVREGRITGPFATKIAPGEVSDLLTSLGLGHDAPAAIFFAVGDEDEASRTLGRLRKRVADALTPPDDHAFSCLWVAEFPWFEVDSKAGRLKPAFNAFAMPLAADLPKLAVQPELVRSSKFELVLNGAQLGSGSLRIHQAALQYRMLEVLGIPKGEILRRFGGLLDALQHGAPPHGGLSIDFDRLVMSLLGAEALDQVIAFPQSGNDPSPPDAAEPSTH